MTREDYENMYANYPAVLNTRQVSEMLYNIELQTVRGMINRKVIASFRVGGRYRIPKEAVIDYLASEKADRLIERKIAERTIYTDDQIESIKMKILVLCEYPQSRRRLMMICGVKSKKTFFRLFLRPLLEAGKLQRTFEDRNCVAIQRYVRTAWKY